MTAFGEWQPECSGEFSLTLKFGLFVGAYAGEEYAL